MIAAPSILWRISNYRDLSGIGGSRGNARWHTAAPSRRIVYLAENPATALLEMLANLKGNPRLFPETYQLLTIELPETVTCLPCPKLSSEWQNRMTETQSIGNDWLGSQTSPLLAVPSVPAPKSTNYLLNPTHPEALRVRVVDVERLAFDKRLFHLDPTQ